MRTRPDPAGPRPRPGSVESERRGSGGGTWDVPINPLGGDGSSAEDVVVVVDAVDFCRLVANRVDPTALELHVVGERAAADGVLAAAAALALD